MQRKMCNLCHLGRVTPFCKPVLQSIKLQNICKNDFKPLHLIVELNHLTTFSLYFY